MTDPASIRVADADREQIAAELREHMLAGRLTAAEFEERLERAYAASTRGDLDALRADLPLSPAALKVAVAERHTKLRRRLREESGGAVALSVACVAVWLLSGASGSFWPGWVILVALLPIVRSAWGLFGPAPDLDTVEAELRRREGRRLERERRHHRRELPR